MRIKMNDVFYCHGEQETEIIFYHLSTASYPVHTHAKHNTIGFVTEGAVCVTKEGKEYIYEAGESFFIPCDIPHALAPDKGKAYSMMCLCIPETREQNEEDDLHKLKEGIMNAPERTLSIEEMAKQTGISPYHMIRSFKSVCGLTPHQFQIQCRVRKAQRMLAEEKSVIEVAYAAGFCDQSHFDRCFQKIVGLTPGQYKQVVRKNS